MVRLFTKRNPIWHTVFLAHNPRFPSDHLMFLHTVHRGTALHSTYVARVEVGHSVTGLGAWTGSTAALECGVRGDRSGSERVRVATRSVPPATPRSPLFIFNRDMEISKPDGKKTKTPADSMQSIYSKPGFDSDPKIKYSDGDKGPFSVYVSIHRNIYIPASGYPFKIQKFAQFLHKNNITGIKEGGIKKLGRYKISVDFISAEKANKFIDLDILEYT
ncbi:unnamed protein product [Leptidea sinapis]|uniref:Uncharacterized protein n=1 Tax=Leptidea sinapis TaxID=189913 RepID=A0A5E4Q1L7_9NEOP|nr:unnamed protein product [Leptidea sinapis]